MLAFTRRLQSAENVEQLMEELINEVRGSVGYQTAWIAQYLPERDAFKILSAAGYGVTDIWIDSPIIPMGADVYLRDLVKTQRTSIIEDAQIDERVDHEVVARLRSRTVVNVPMVLIDQPFGAIGTGTFGDEGVRVPTAEEIKYLEELAQHVVLASARILISVKRQEAQLHKAELDQLLARRQRLESIGQLAGGVAHDFNNLLTVIRASAQMLREEVTDPEQSEGLKLIERAAVSASELTSRLLALGKRQRLLLAPVDIRSSLSDVSELIERVLPASIVVKTDSTEDLSPVIGDDNQLEQVLVNLCLNARDAMPDGGTIALSAENFEITPEFVESQPWAMIGDFVLINVTDTGEGIGADALERIFEPFYTTKAELEGSGLGLAVSRAVVEQHGGMINVYSEPGIGTTFKVYLPISDKPAGLETVPAAPGRTGSGEKILVADDQDDVRAVIARVLTRAGYEVESVNDGAQAVERALAYSFDLVVLDAVMPNLGGRAAREKIIAQKPDTPIVFVTGYAGEDLTNRVLGVSEVPVLQKPFDPAELLRIVRSALDKSNVA